MLLERHAKTDEPYKKIFNNDEFPMMAAAPIIRIPVPKKKEEAMEIPKYLLKIMLRKVYKLAHPKLITIFPKIAMIKEPTFTWNEV